LHSLHQAERIGTNAKRQTGMVMANAMATPPQIGLHNLGWSGL